MAQYAVPDGSVIVNVVEAPDWMAEEHGWVPLADLPAGAGIGWTTPDGGKTWEPPPQPIVAAQGQLAQLSQQVPEYAEQIQADLDAWSNLQPGAPLTADHIAAVVHLIAGMATVMQALQALGEATGVASTSG